MDGFLTIAFVFLIAGVIAVPLASRFGLGSVLGYLIAGIAIAPILSALNVDVIALQHFAEFGVVMMLFLVGLELEPRRLWELRSKLLGMGGGQVVITMMVVAAVAVMLGQSWQVALAIGMVLTLSSTAIVLQTLNEKGLIRSDGGQASFSVLLAQDVAVIPMLALLPLLAISDITTAGHASLFGVDVLIGAGESHDDHGSGFDLMAGLPVWGQVVVTFGAIGAVIGGGSYLTRPLFRFVATAGLRELFTATALLMVIGIALLMTMVNLSPALGAFIAGVVLANSEYRHELESDIDPFRGLLLGLFFMTVGASINFGLLADSILPVLAMTFGLIALKAAVLYGLGILFKINGADRWLFALGLAQAGEFGFVLLSFTTANNIMPAQVAELLLLVVAISMLLTPLLFILYDRVIAPQFDQALTREADVIEEEAPIIIAGVGRFGGLVNRLLMNAGHQTVVIDHSSDQLDIVRTFGIQAFFGDASRPDLLHAAGIESAKLLVVAIDDAHQAIEIVKYVKSNHPHLHVVARASDRHHVYQLYQAGADDIIREHFDSAVRAGRSALEALGMHPFDAERESRIFAEQDKAFLAHLAPYWRSDIPATENKEYVAAVQHVRDELGLVATERREKGFATGPARAWAPPGMVTKPPKDTDPQEIQIDQVTPNAPT